MKILFCGDVSGRSGRDALKKYIPQLRQQLNLDFVVVNGENAAHGFGITPVICKEMYDAGVDVISTGNHIWKQKEIISYMGTDKRLLRPVNYPATAPGYGYGIYETAANLKVLVINVIGRVFMEPADDPFAAVQNILSTYSLGSNVHAVIIDIHGEATSEKYAMGHFVDGRATLVVGSHSHVPTADHHILKKGTAYQTDAGMCGDYESIIGLKADMIMMRFLKSYANERPTPADGEATLCGIYVESDDKTGLAKVIKPIRLGGILHQAIVE